MSSNNLSGEIPSTVNHLNNPLILWLEVNRFSGQTHPRSSPIGIGTPTFEASSEFCETETTGSEPQLGRSVYKTLLSLERCWITFGFSILRGTTFYGQFPTLLTSQDSKSFCTHITSYSATFPSPQQNFSFFTDSICPITSSSGEILWRLNHLTNRLTLQLDVNRFSDSISFPRFSNMKVINVGKEMEPEKRLTSS
ncbi:hypothetical protein ACE6H2_002745 [Prunus campanulata]